MTVSEEETHIKHSVRYKGDASVNACGVDKLDMLTLKLMIEEEGSIKA